MNHEEYGNFIDIENSMTGHFPDNLNSMSKKYKIRSMNKYFYKINQLNNFHFDVSLNIMNTIPEINEKIYINENNCNYHNNNDYNFNDNCNQHSSDDYRHKKTKYSYKKIFITILILCILCIKYYYFLHNFV